MILFRLLSLALRIIGSFFFVFCLQIQFDGKTLESYLNDFGKTFFVTRALHKVSQDGVKVIRTFSSDESKSKSDSSQAKRIPSSKALQYAKDFTNRITLPTGAEKSKQEKKDSLKNY